jgi:glucose uptake protein
MFIPESFITALMMMLGGMICWGSWPSIQKLANWRFELFYYDFATGIFAAGALIAVTLGTLFGSPTCWENLATADRTAIVLTLLSGVIWNIANVLLVNGIALVGMAVAFLMAIGSSLVLSTIGGYLVMPRGNPVLLAAGVAFILGAVIVNSLAYSSAATERKQGSRKGLIACLLAGVLISTVGPVVGNALSAKPQLGPYGITLLFTCAAFASTFPILYFFMRHPLEGSPTSAAGYRKGTIAQHAYGLSAGAVWTLGTALTWAAANQVGIALAMAIGQANPLVAAGWGVFMWHEFKGAPRSSKMLLVLMFALYVVGLMLLVSSRRNFTSGIAS